MMNNLARTPLARDGMRGKAIGREAVQGVHDFLVSGSILCNEVDSFFGCHWCSFLYVRGYCFEESIMRGSILPQRRTNTLGLNSRALLLYYPPEPSAPTTPWCFLPSEPPVSF